MKNTSTDPNQISETLLRWYESHARILPWRQIVSPYRTLVSEVMLQQTRVATVIPYFERWMKSYPDILSLADAPEDAVLKSWEGLGYYRRARSLHKLAREVKKSHGGQLPREESALLALPGIGPYTAGAILSIAFNEPVPAIDGNVERVLSRLYDIELTVDKAPGKRRLGEIALQLIPEGRARAMCQALMELGATVCLPRAPLCNSCPLAAPCRGLSAGTLDQRPVKSPRPQTRPLFAGAIILARNGRFLLFRRPSKGLMAGLWEFPTAFFENQPGIAEMNDVVRSVYGLEADTPEFLCTIRHSFTRYRVTLRAFLCRDVRGTPRVEEQWEPRWVTPREMDEFAFSAGSRKIRERCRPLLHSPLPDSAESFNIP